MKKAIRYHRAYGEILYKKDRWIKVEPLKGNYNNSSININVALDILDTSYTEYELGINSIILEYCTIDRLQQNKKENDEYSKKVEERYIQYLVNIEDTMKKIEEVITNDYARYRREWTEEEVKKYNSQVNAKKILKASSQEEILDLVKIKHIIVYDDRIVLELKCPWYTSSDAGMLLNENGTIEIGNGEMMQ